MTIDGSYLPSCEELARHAVQQQADELGLADVVLVTQRTHSRAVVGATVGETDDVLDFHLDVIDRSAALSPCSDRIEPLDGSDSAAEITLSDDG